MKNIAIALALIAPSLFARRAGAALSDLEAFRSDARSTVKPERLIVESIDSVRMTVDLPVHQMRVLKKWASVSRTFDEAIRCMDGDSDEDDCRDALSAMRELRRPIDALHKSVQFQLFQVDL